MANHHDKIFKTIFGEPEYAATLFEGVLSAELRAMLDLSKMTRVAGSVVDRDMRERHIDLLFQVPLQPEVTASDAPVSAPLLFLLFEHQSSNDPRMAWRMLNYMTRVWDRWTRANPKGPLPPIYPLVLYQGPRRWRAKQQFSEQVALGNTAALGAYTPTFHYALHELARMPEAVLPPPGIVRMTLVLMRAAQRGITREDLLSTRPDITAAHTPGRTDHHLHAVANLLQYALVVSDRVNQHTVTELMEPLDDELREMAMTFEELLIEKYRKRALQEGRSLGIDEGRELGRRQGRQLGLEQGLERGLEQGLEQGLQAGALQARREVAQRALATGLTVQQVSQLVGIPEEEVAVLMNA